MTEPHSPSPEGSSQESGVPPVASRLNSEIGPRPEDGTEESHPDVARDLVREIKTRLARIGQRELDVQRRESELERQYTFLEAYAREIEQKQQSAPTALPGTESAIPSAELEVRNREVEQQQGKLERLRAQVAASEIELAQRKTELDHRREELEARRAEVDSRQASLTVSQTELAARHGEVLARQSELIVRQSEIEERQAAVQRLYDEASNVEGRIRQSQVEIASLREQLSAREAQLSHSALQVEVERDQLQNERARMHAEREELRAFRESAARPRSGAGWKWLAIPALGGAAFFAAQWAWLQYDALQFRATNRLDVLSDRVKPESAVAEQLRELSTPGLIDGRLDDPAVAAAVRSARLLGRISVASGTNPPALEVSVVDGSAETAKALANAMSSAYAGYAAQIAPDRLSQPALDTWSQLRQAAEAELAEARRIWNEAKDKSGGSANFDDWEQANSEFESTQREFYEISDKLGEERGRLAALRATEMPRGQVSEEQIGSAVADDLMLLEDRRELASAAGKYQFELALAMVNMIDPASELREAVRTLYAAAVEQRDLQPPQAIRAVLEQIVSDLEVFEGAATEFGGRWNQQKLSIERLRPLEQVDELVRSQATVAEMARVFANDAREFLERVNRRVEEIAGKGEAGTREQVILSMLRGNLSQVADKAKAVVGASAVVDSEVNFKLDAQDRNIRGVRGRLTEREAAVKRGLQETADQNAVGQRDLQITQTQDRVREMERKREDLSEQLKQRLASLRALQGKTQDARVTLADLAVKEQAVLRHEARLRELEKQRPAPQIDRVILGSTEVEQIAGHGREERAKKAAAWSGGVAGLTAFVLLLLGRLGGSQYSVKSK